MKQQTTIAELQQASTLKQQTQKDIKLSIVPSTQFSSKHQQQISNEQSPQQKQQLSCKICLQQINKQNKQKQQLISPCNCTGSMKYIHQLCLRQWLNTQVNRNLQNGVNTYYIICQICKYSYQYQTEQKTVCNNKQEIAQRIKQNMLIFGVGLFFIAISIIAIISVAVASQQGVLKMDQYDTGYTTFIIVFLIFLTVLIVWSIRFILTFFIKKICLVKKVFEKVGGEQNSLNYLNAGMHNISGFQNTYMNNSNNPIYVEQ